jgi:hypothetical protein
MAAVGPKRRKSMPGWMSAFGGNTGLVVLASSFVTHDPYATLGSLGLDVRLPNGAANLLILPSDIGPKVRSAYANCVGFLLD